MQCFPLLSMRGLYGVSLLRSKAATPLPLYSGGVGAVVPLGICFLYLNHKEKTNKNEGQFLSYCHPQTFGYLPHFPAFLILESPGTPDFIGVSELCQFSFIW